METSRTLYESEDELEIRAIAAFLEESGVACSTVFRKETAYPGMFDRHAKHSILVAEEDFERAEALAADFLESEAQALEGGPYREDALDADPETRIDEATHRALVGARIARARAWLIGLVLTSSLGMNAMVFVGSLMEEPMREGEYETFDADGTLLWLERYSGRRFSDEVKTYEADGRHSWTSFDRDGNGRFERTVNHHGDEEGLETVWTGLEPGRSTVGTLYRAGSEVLRSVDEDEDDLADRWMLGTGAGARDRDRDGFPDLFDCAPGARVAQVDLAACLGSEVR